MLKKEKTITFITLGDVSNLATMKRALGMANPLYDLGWSVSIICENCEENKKRISIECYPEIKILYYDKGSIFYEVKIKTQLIKENRPNYIYFCSFSMRNRIEKYKLNYKPEMIIEHSELSSSIPDNKGIKKLLAIFFEISSIYYATRLVCASKYLEKYFVKYAKKFFKNDLPILYSPYAFSSDVINAPKVIFNKLKSKYKEKKVFLYMGRMTRNYGLFTMIDAAHILSEKYNNFVLVLMGKGRHLEESKKYVKEKKLQDVVEFPGYIPENNLSSYFEVADAFISPVNKTIQDIARCPSKIYMYLPFQKPVFTCRLGEPKEIFGDNGFYFDNSKPNTLANLMLDTFRDTKSNLDINIENHSWKKRSIDFDNWISNSK